MDSLALLQELAAGGQADPAALLAEHADPRLRLLAQLWSRRAAAEAEAPEPPAPPEPAANGVSARRPHSRRLVAELRRLREINDTLAAALGACYLCWGEDPDCGVCRGRGRSGARRADPGLYAALVRPAVRRMEAAGGRPPVTTPTQPRIPDPGPNPERSPE